MKTGDNTPRLVQGFFYNNPDNYPPIINGVRLLAKAGWQVELFCRDDGKIWDVTYPPQVEVHRIKVSGSSWKQYFSFLRETTRHGANATIYLGHDMHGFVPARILGTRYRRPVVYHCHDFSEPAAGEPWGGRVVRRFERRFARSANLVIVPDADRAKIIATKLRLATPPLVAANAPLAASTAAANSLRQALAERSYSFDRIIFRQGRIGPGHAIEATIKSIPYWKSDSWGFVVMGLSEESYVQGLNAMAQELGVAKQFVVLPPVGYDQVAGFTADADVGHALYDPVHINNVHITTASNKIMEYLKAGLPLLVSKQPSLANLVKKHGCGLAADETSPQSIAASINLLLSGNALVTEAGKAGSRAFKEIFCYERQMAPVLDALDELARAGAVLKQQAASGSPSLI